jgi:branched-chain amino acid transport system ATP-binding protein
MPFLEISGLDRSFGGLRAVNNVSFNVEQGSIKAVIGPNGAGKTTLFNLIAGALRPDGGAVLFDGHDISGLPSHRIAEHGILRTFQNIKLFPQMTVLDNILVGLHTRGTSGFLKGMVQWPAMLREEEALRDRADEMLAFFGLTDEADTEAARLPFGRQRAVEFARALAASPKLLLLDEPAAGLNIHETRELAGQIMRIHGTGVTVLIVEHDMSLIMDISQEIAVLSYGVKIAEGSPSEIQRNPEVVRVYLGENDAEDPQP